MTIRNLDANNDWIFGNGKNDYIVGDPAIALDIRTRLYSWVGDCYFDTQAGVDWYNRLGSKNQRQLLEADIRRIILTTVGVVGIISFDTVLTQNRRFIAHYTIITQNSQSYRDSVELGVSNG